MHQIGIVIKRTREYLGITQETLSNGICSVETLSRIENGKHVPNRNHFQALMERMGKSGERYLPFLHSNDIDRFNEFESIERKFFQRKFEEVDILLSSLESQINMDDSINKQLILRLRTLNDYYSGKIDVRSKRIGLLQALKYTIPNFNENQIASSIYSRYEVRLLCNLAATYAEEKNFTHSISLFRKLEQYFSNSKINKEELYQEKSLFLSNYAQVLGQFGNTSSALQMNDAGISICLETGEGERLSTFLYNKGFEMEIYGMNDDSCKKTLLQAYYVAELYNNEKKMAHIAKHWKEKYGDDISA